MGTTTPATIYANLAILACTANVWDGTSKHSIYSTGCATIRWRITSPPRISNRISSQGNHHTKTINVDVDVDVDVEKEGVVVAMEVEDSNTTRMECHQRQQWACHTRKE